MLGLVLEHYSLVLVGGKINSSKNHISAFLRAHYVFGAHLVFETIFHTFEKYKQLSDVCVLSMCHLVAEKK